MANMDETAGDQRRGARRGRSYRARGRARGRAGSLSTRERHPQNDTNFADDQNQAGAQTIINTGLWSAAGKAHSTQAAKALWANNSLSSAVPDGFSAASGSSVFNQANSALPGIVALENRERSRGSRTKNASAVTNFTSSQQSNNSFGVNPFDVAQRPSAFSSFVGTSSTDSEVPVRQHLWSDQFQPQPLSLAGSSTPWNTEFRPERPLVSSAQSSRTPLDDPFNDDTVLAGSAQFAVTSVPFSSFRAMNGPGGQEDRSETILPHAFKTPKTVSRDGTLINDPFATSYASNAGGDLEGKSREPVSIDLPRHGNLFPDAKGSKEFEHAQTARHASRKYDEHAEPQASGGRNQRQLLMRHLPGELLSEVALRQHFETTAEIVPEAVSMSRSKTGAVKRSALVTFSSASDAVFAKERGAQFHGQQLIVDVYQPHHFHTVTSTADKKSLQEDSNLPTLDVERNADSVARDSLENEVEDPLQIKSAPHLQDDIASKAAIEKLRADIRAAEMRKNALKERKNAKKPVEALELSRKENMESGGKGRSLDGSARDGEQASAQHEESMSSKDRWRAGAGKVTLDEAVDFVGECQDMCPVAEQENRKDISVFEMSRDDNGVMRADPKKMVKKYQRSAAAAEVQGPLQVRPPVVLERTLDYLVSEILASEVGSLSDRYHFISDRTRCIRQDLTMHGSMYDNVSLAILEKAVRFHILSEHQLCWEDIEVFDSKLNLEQLEKCLISVLAIYDMRRERDMDSQHEAEFQAYNIIRFSRPQDINRVCAKLPSRILHSVEVQHALRAMTCIADPVNIYAQYFRLVREAPYLTACLMQKKFAMVRLRGLDMMNVAMGTSRVPARVACDDIVDILGFEDEAYAAKFCQWHGLAVESGHVVLHSSSLQTNPEHPWKDQKVDGLIQRKVVNTSLSDIIFGNSCREFVLPPAAKLSTSHAAAGTEQYSARSTSSRQAESILAALLTAASNSPQVIQSNNGLAGPTKIERDDSGQLPKLLFEARNEVSSASRNSPKFPEEPVSSREQSEKSMQELCEAKAGDLDSRKVKIPATRKMVAPHSPLSSSGRSPIEMPLAGFKKPPKVDAEGSRLQSPNGLHAHLNTERAGTAPKWPRKDVMVSFGPRMEKSELSLHDQDCNDLLISPSAQSRMNNKTQSVEGFASRVTNTGSSSSLLSKADTAKSPDQRLIPPKVSSPRLSRLSKTESKSPGPSSFVESPVAVGDGAKELVDKTLESLTLRLDAVATGQHGPVSLEHLIRSGLRLNAADVKARCREVLSNLQGPIRADISAVIAQASALKGDVDDKQAAVRSVVTARGKSLLAQTDYYIGAVQELGKKLTLALFRQSRGVAEEKSYAHVPGEKLASLGELRKSVLVNDPLKSFTRVSDPEIAPPVCKHPKSIVTEIERAMLACGLRLLQATVLIPRNHSTAVAKWTVGMVSRENDKGVLACSSVENFKRCMLSVHSSEREALPRDDALLVIAPIDCDSSFSLQIENLKRILGNWAQDRKTSGGTRKSPILLIIADAKIDHREKALEEITCGLELEKAVVEASIERYRLTFVTLSGEHENFEKSQERVCDATLHVVRDIAQRHTSEYEYVPLVDAAASFGNDAWLLSVDVFEKRDALSTRNAFQRTLTKINSSWQQLSDCIRSEALSMRDEFEIVKHEYLHMSTVVRGNLPFKNIENVTFATASDYMRQVVVDTFEGENSGIAQMSLPSTSHKSFCWCLGQIMFLYVTKHLGALGSKLVSIPRAKSHRFDSVDARGMTIVDNWRPSSNRHSSRVSPVTCRKRSAEQEQSRTIPRKRSKIAPSELYSTLTTGATAFSPPRPVARTKIKRPGSYDEAVFTKYLQLCDALEAAVDNRRRSDKWLESLI